MTSNVAELPVHMTVFVNWKCNLRCRECWLYGDSSHDNAWLETAINDEMTIELFTDLVNQLLDYDNKTSISLMGGEPLLNRSLPQMIQYLKSMSASSYIDVSTNGTTLHKDAETLFQSGIDQIYVSLDGSNAEINDRLRGQGSFVRAMRGLDHAIALRPAYPKTRVSANFTVTALNFEDLPNIVELCKAKGLDELSVNFTMVYDEAEGLAASREFAPVIGRSFDSWRGFTNTAMAEGVEPSSLSASIERAHEVAQGINLVFSPVQYSSAERGHYFSPQWKRLVKEKRCRRLELQSTILPNGDILSCTPFADTVMGNLSEQSLSEIWHGSRYGEIRDLLNGQGLTAVCHRCCDLNMDIDPILSTLEMSGSR